ncbi:MAG: magnesium transporter [Thermoplasmata archaeon]|nr:magnesium transporter [Thermoplasmata archaeon]
MELHSIIKQSLPLIILCGVGGIFAGSVFGNMTELLLAMPGLIVLIPALMNLKGNIHITLGSRLGSAAHMGLISIDELWNKELRENISASFILTIILAVFAGFFAYITCNIFGLPIINPLILIAIAVVTAVLAGVILIFSTILIIILAFKRGLDPDNITAPILATVGDLITLGCLFFIAYIFKGVI